MNDMGRVAQQGQPLADEASRHAEGERIRLGRRLDMDGPEPVAEARLQFFQQIVVMKTQQGCGIRRRLSPDNRRAVATVGAIR